MRQHGLGQLHDAEDIHVVELADLLHAEIFEEAAQPHAGEMHDRVDAAGIAEDCLHSVIDLAAAGNIHAQSRKFHAAAGALCPQLLLLGFGDLYRECYKGKEILSGAGDCCEYRGKLEDNLHRPVLICWIFCTFQN